MKKEEDMKRIAREILSAIVNNTEVVFNDIKMIA